MLPYLNSNTVGTCWRYFSGCWLLENEWKKLPPRFSLVRMATFMTGQPTPPATYPPAMKTHWFPFIRPAMKNPYFRGEVRGRGGVIGATPTPRGHYKGNPSKLPYVWVVWSPQNKDHNLVCILYFLQFLLVFLRPRRVKFKNSPPVTTLGRNYDCYHYQTSKLPNLNSGRILLGGSSHLVSSWTTPPFMSAMKTPFGRGPTTRSLGDENDHHG